uniref:DUF7830 domain-containing protein n=1 Tax=Lysinibacillus sphaericus TaxID=1421 RepID=UPI003FEDE9AE
MYILPQNISPQEIQNHKQNANKGTFICPYCQAKLSVSSGPERGNYFKHKHGEGCSHLSKVKLGKVDMSNKKRMTHIVTIIFFLLCWDELEVISKTYENISCTLATFISDNEQFVFKNNSMSCYIHLLPVVCYPQFIHQIT